MDQQQENVAAVARKWKQKPGTLVMALHDLQDRFGYVPRDAALDLAGQMSIPLARVYEVLTFYSYFKLEPPARNTISICMGTACYLKGSGKILDRLSAHLGIGPGETTPDGEYHLRLVRCLGCCGLAPVVTVNGEPLARLTEDECVERVCGAKGAVQCQN